jgi:cytosine/adenosine deaminase-related metal-dependent hydrolase
MASPFSDSLAIRARWVLPIDRPPIANGIVTVAGARVTDLPEAKLVSFTTGRILAVGENLSGRPPYDLGNVALLPGLVNAHTHLEFSSLEHPLGKPGMPFPAWIQEVIGYRQRVLEQHFQQPAEMVRLRQEAICRGLQECDWRGTAAVGEIGTRTFTDWCPDQLHWGGPQCTVFLELLGLASNRAPELLELAADYLHSPPTNFTRGLSPHAPYTVGPALLDSVCRLSAKQGAPLAMHLAESREELQLMASHDGPMVDLLTGLGAWHPEALPPGTRPLDYLRQLSSASRALVIHGNYLAPDEVDFLAAHRERMSLVYCPRTHAYFGHEPYPLAEMLAAGVRVAVGTDSRASNPDLNLWTELQHIAAHHANVPPETILRMGTLDGAEALGIADQFGTITPGKRAALAVVPIDPDVDDPAEALLAWDTLATIWCEQIAGVEGFSHPLRYLLK